MRVSGGIQFSKKRQWHSDKIEEEKGAQIVIKEPEPKRRRPKKELDLSTLDKVIGGHGTTISIDLHGVRDGHDFWIEMQSNKRDGITITNKQMRKKNLNHFFGIVITGD